jgi:hypothetical protein
VQAWCTPVLVRTEIIAVHLDARLHPRISSSGARMQGCSVHSCVQRIMGATGLADLTPAKHTGRMLLQDDSTEPTSTRVMGVGLGVFLLGSFL